MNNQEIIFKKVKERIYTNRYGKYTDTNIKIKYFFSTMLFICILFFIGMLTLIGISAALFFENIYDIILIIVSICGIALSIYESIHYYNESIFSLNNDVKKEINENKYKIYTLDSQSKEKNFYKVKLSGEDEIIGYTINLLTKGPHVVRKINDLNYIIGDEIMCIHEKLLDDTDLKIQEKFLEITKEITNEELDPYISLDKQGVDSLEFFEILIAIEEEYDIDLPIEIVSSDTSLHDIEYQLQSIFEQGCV